MDDGTWSVIGMNNNSFEGTVWTSSDEGNTWEQGKNITDELPKDKIKEDGNTEYSSTLSSTGEIFVRAYYYEKGNWNSYEIGYYLISESGVIELPIVLSESQGDMKNEIGKVVFGEDGRLFVSDFLGNVLQLDKEDGKTERTYRTASSILDFAVTEDTVYICNFDSVKGYDIETGERRERSESLEALENIRTNVVKKEDIGELYFQLTTETAEENQTRGYAFDGRNIRKFTEGKEGVVAEAITLSHQEYGYVQRMVITEDAMLVLGWDGTGTQLWKYKQSEQMREIEEEINVYSLRENRSLRQWISLYEKQNPQIKVNLEIGMEDTELSKSDAISLLNTKILAGEGPDIFCLDGLNVENLISKGVLLDFGESLNGWDDEYEMLENIVNTYREGDAIYALPLNFEFITALGRQEEANAARSMNSYVSRVEAGEKMSLPTFFWGMFFITYYQTDFMNGLANGKSTEESIRTFYEQLEVVYHAQGDKELALGAFWELELYPERIRGLLGWPLQGGDNLILDYVASPGDLQTIIMIRNNLELIDVEIGEGENKYFVPRNVLGINSQSKNATRAEEFVGFALEHSGHSGKFSVSENILKEQLETTAADVWQIGDKQFEQEVLSQSNQEAYLKLFRELRIPASTNEELFQILLEQGVKFLGEEQTLEQAVKAANDRMHLYFLE